MPKVKRHHRYENLQDVSITEHISFQMAVPAKPSSMVHTA